MTLAEMWGRMRGDYTMPGQKVLNLILLMKRIDIFTLFM